MTTGFRRGNRVELLVDGEQFYPRAMQAFDQAQHEIFVETFIIFDDRVGRDLQRALIRAAERGVRVELTLDAWGSMALSEEFLDTLVRSGVCVHLFEHRKPRWRLRISWFRRLHRKLIVVDESLALIGGLNFSEEHLDGGANRKHDYALAVHGPVVTDIHALARESIDGAHPRRAEAPAQGGRPRDEDRAAGSAEAKLVVRDNTGDRRMAIEEEYREAIRRARHRLYVANAYFIPSYAILREIRDAAQRGVDVRLITQQTTHMPIVHFGGALLYDYLLEAGVRVYEDVERNFHGKVALIDDDWVTVGSSNLDPLSLCFSLEANLVIRDEALNRTVREKLERLMQTGCRRIEHGPSGRLWPPIATFLVFRLIRRFSWLARLLPEHRPRLLLVGGDDHPEGPGAVGPGEAGEQSDPPDEAAAEPPGPRRWSRLKKVLGLLFFVAVALLIAKSASEIEWGQVGDSIGAYQATTLLVAAGLAAAGHLVYTTYDLLAGAYVGHGLRRLRVMKIAFISYALNLNFGPLVGTMASRFRLYSAAGVRAGVIGRVVGFSVITNWLGYLLVAGSLFALEVVELPADWALGTTALQLLGIAAVLLVLAYVVLCRLAGGRRLRVRRLEVELPPLGMAILQLLAASASWLVMGAVLFSLLQGAVSYATALGVLLLAAVAALLTHIPAGLGVLEATVVLLLGHVLLRPELLAAVLVYRVVYYLVPLVPAAGMFLWLEARGKRIPP